MNIAKIERIWLLIGGGMLVAFMAILLVSAAALGAGTPGGMDTIDPGTVLVSGVFAHPGVTQTGPHSYLVRVAAYTFGYTPNLITVPVGAKVTFNLATRDVVHGFEIVDTDVNTMIIPGYISEVSHTFNTKGTFLIICNEYCGTGHQLMYAHIKVV